MADPVGDVPDDNFNDPTAAIDQEEVSVGAALHFFFFFLVPN